MIKSFYTLFFIGLISFSCSTPSQSTAKFQSTRRPLPEAKYYVDIDKNGLFESIELEEKPEPKQGQSQWLRDFYGSIKYPAIARQNGIGGIVVLEVSIDEFGRIQDVNIKESLSKECDEEAKRAFIASTKQGYSPLRLESAAVKFKVDIPVGFWLV